MATCDPQLVRLFEDVIQAYDCIILQGARSAAEQAENVRKGVSKTLDSKHVTSESHPLARAVDVAPFPLVWPDKKKQPIDEYALAVGRFYHFAGHVMAVAKAIGVDVRWGGAWSGELNKIGAFMDLPHWELVG